MKPIDDADMVERVTIHCSATYWTVQLLCLRL